MKAKKIPIFVDFSPSKLAKHLTKTDTSNIQKAFSIYSWITENIKYDVNEYRKAKPKHYTVKQTLFKKKGVCYEYSNLFSLLCQSAGIPTLEIVGYGRGGDYDEDENFYEDNHSWNGIKLDSNWYFVDATWGSGNLVKKNKWLGELGFNWFKIPYLNDRYKFKKQFKPKYFLMDPENLISTHLPVDPSWQLLQFPVALKTFEDNNWQGYKNRMDSLYKFDISNSLYNKKLNKYSTLSPLQYLDQTAIKSNEFNPINFELLAHSNYSFGNSFQKSLGKTEQQIKDKITAIGYYKNSIKYAQNHQKTTTTQSAKMIKKVNDRIGNSLTKPILKRINNTSTIYRRSYDIVAQEKINKIKIQNELLKIENQLNAIENIPLQKSNAPSRLTAEAIPINKNMIDNELINIKRFSDSVKLQKISLDYLLKDKENLQKNIIEVTEQLNKTISVGTSSVINIELIKILEKIHEKVSVHGDSLDSYNRKLIALEKEIGLQRYNCGQINSAIISKSKLIQKLLTQNCNLSKGLDCNEELYNKMADQIYENSKEKYTMANLSFRTTIKDYKFHRKLNVNLYQQLERLKIHLSFVQLYQKSRIGYILLAKNRSDYFTQKLINDSNKNLFNIPFEINRLNKNNN